MFKSNEEYNDPRFILCVNGIKRFECNYENCDEEDA